MNLSWLFFTRADKGNRIRLALTTLAVTLGVVIILGLISGINGVMARQNIIQNWLGVTDNEENFKPIDGVAPLKIKGGSFGSAPLKWQDESIFVISLHATGENSPSLPGIKTPAPGEYYVSEAMDKIIKENPESDLGGRFGDKQIGVLQKGAAGVETPDDLAVVRGMDRDEANSGVTQPAEEVSEMYKSENSHDEYSMFGASGLMMLVFGGTILVTPIIVFLSVATQLGSAQREKRYSALRLVGATRRQVLNIIAAESLMASLIGVALGVVVHQLILPLIAEFKLGSGGFYVEDLAVSPGQYLTMILMVLGFSLFANWWGMRHVQISPLGVVRTGKISKRPKAWRLILLLPSVLFFAWLSSGWGADLVENNIQDESQAGVFMLAGVMAILGVMFGLLLAGPWLTSGLSRLFAWRTKNPTVLLASKRIASQSGRVFRSVSGVVLALFAGSFYLTVVSDIANYEARAVKENGFSRIKNDVVLIFGDDVTSDLTQKIKQKKYVESMTQKVEFAKGEYYFSCGDVQKYTEMNCPEGAKSSDLAALTFENDKKVDLAGEGASAQNGEYGSAFIKLTSNDELDNLRTDIIKATNFGADITVVSGTNAKKPFINPIVSQLTTLTYAGIGLTLFVAILSLIVSTIGGIYERRRSFLTLRLGGMTTKQMQRVVMVESVVPLISVSILACVLGVWIGMVFMDLLATSALNAHITPTYLVVVAGSLILAILAIRYIVPILGKITDPEKNQTE